MYKIDIRHITSAYRNDLVYNTIFTSTLLDRIQYFSEMRKWLHEKPYRFVYDEISSSIPAYVEIEDEQDALAFKLIFKV